MAEEKEKVDGFEMYFGNEISRIGHELNWRRGRGNQRCLPGFWCLIMPRI